MIEPYGPPGSSFSLKHKYPDLGRQVAVGKTNGTILGDWCTTHFRTYFSGDWDVHWGYDLDVDPWSCVLLEDTPFPKVDKGKPLMLTLA